jgi:PAS domain S-box-containing protein
LINKQGIIVSSTCFAWIGLNAKKIIEHFDPNVSNIVTKGGQSQFIPNSKLGEIYGYYPIKTHPHDQLHNKKNSQYAVLYSEYDYNEQIHALQKNQQKSLISFVIGLILISLILIFVLRRWLHKPLKEILMFIDNIQLHGEQSKLAITGSREMVQLAETLSNMHSSLQASQSELSQTHSLLENLLNSAPDLIFYKNNKGVYLGCNQAFCNFAGKTSENDIIGLTDFDLFDKELAEFFHQKDQTMLRKGKEQRNEEWVTYPDGQQVLLDTLKTPYYNKNKEIIGVIGISRDITATKELEEKFNQAQKMEAVGTLVGGIAHDFNNVLAGITGNLYLAKKRLVDNPDVTKKLVNIETLSLRAADMIKQLLTFARKDTVRMQQLSLSSLIEETIQLLHTSVPENIIFKENICTDPLIIKGDETQLQQVLMNLINNARDAVESTDQPCITMTVESFQPDHEFVEYHPEASSKCYAHISIQDNGYGIPKDTLEHILEPFFTTKMPGKGTGLGLSMVFGAVKTHHGILDIESIEGDGSTFHIYIPLLQEKAPTQPEAKHIAETNAHGELILLVDDEAFVRETTAEVLEAFGYKVLQAEDGLQAIDVFKKHQHAIDIVILDVVMPKLGGVESAAHIRMINANIPIIFITGYDKEQMLKLDNQASNSTVLGKPIQFDKLHSIISQKLVLTVSKKL